MFFYLNLCTCPNIQSKYANLEDFVDFFLFYAYLKMGLHVLCDLVQVGSNLALTSYNK